MKKVQNDSSEFRHEVVKTIYEQGMSLSEASRRLSVPKGTLVNWMAAACASIKKPSNSAWRRVN